jgi:asparagine synthase (glutamine-hydrolysing)
MTACIRHRGPDDEGHFVEGDAGLGMRRLSIIDVVGGHQPIANEDGSLLIVFNGEIYNYRALRDQLLGRGHQFRTGSDTEVILHLFEDEGPSPATSNGMGLCLGSTRRRLFLARDRRPLPYYRQHGSALMPASEVKALLRYQDGSQPCRAGNYHSPLPKAVRAI